MLENINPSLHIYNNEQGYLFLANIDKNGKFKQAPFNCDELIQANTYIINNEGKNIYNTCAIFNNKYRSARNVKKILVHYVDIDNHIQGFTLDQAQELKNYLEPYFNTAIPKPSTLMYTGRGIQLQFKLIGAEDTIKFNYTQRGLNKKIQSLLYKNNAYTLLNVDSLEDSARVLRTANTINTKSNTYSKVLYSSEAQYTQDEILRRFNLDYINEKGKNKGKKTHLKDLEGLNVSEVVRLKQSEQKQFKSYIKQEYTRETINQERQRDLFKLVEIRNNKGYLEGYRNNLISILIPLLTESKANIEDIRETLEELNNAFKSPLSDSELMAWVNQVKRFKGYQSNKYIINKLEITEDEQKALSVLISKKEVNRRYYSSNKEIVKAKAKISYKISPQKKIEQVKANNKKHKAKIKQYNNNYYLDHIEPLLSKANNKYAPIKACNKVNKLVLKAQAKELYNNGVKPKEIMKRLKISKMSLYRYIKEG